MKRLLITGASGFLGSRIAIYFKDKYEVFSPTHMEMEITNKRSVEAVLAEYKPDVVLHCAAVSDVGQCEKERDWSWNINVDGSVNVARAANMVGAKCILCSSDQVYFGKQIIGAHREEEELAPANWYGREKLTAEKECLRVNPDCVLLRLSWMYDTENIKKGEHGDFMRTFVSKMSSDAVLEYPVYDIRGISNVKEVVYNLEKAVDLPGGVYNFGSPNDKCMYETILAVFHNLELDIKRLSRNETAFKDNPRNISMNQGKINRYGIYFSTTEDNLTKCIGKILS